MQTEHPLTVSRASSSQTDILAKNTIAMALESENVTLDAEQTTIATKVVFENPKYGNYIAACKGDTIVGSLLVTFEYNYIKNRTIYWIQTVYTHPDHRNQGVYSSNYKFVLKDGKEHDAYTVKLYVEVDNHKADAVYKKLGMTRTSELMLEIDLAFRAAKKIDDSAYEYADRDKLTVKALDNAAFEESKKLKFKHVLGERGVAINYEGLESILKGNDKGEVLVVESEGKVLALLGVFFEFSDWRNSVTHYIYDVRVVDSVGDEELERMSAVILTKVVQLILQRNCRVVRMMFTSEYEWTKEMIKKIGFEEPHYAVYEQVL